MAAIDNTIFSPTLAARFDHLVTIYPVKRSALVPMLLYAQDEIGYVSEPAIQEIAQRLDLFDLEVRNVLSYYSMLRTKPAGRYNVQVCTNTRHRPQASHSRRPVLPRRSRVHRRLLLGPRHAGQLRLP